MSRDWIISVPCTDYLQSTSPSTSTSASTSMHLHRVHSHHIIPTSFPTPHRHNFNEIVRLSRRSASGTVRIDRPSLQKRRPSRRRRRRWTPSWDRSRSILYCCNSLSAYLLVDVHVYFSFVSSFYGRASFQFPLIHLVPSSLIHQPSIIVGPVLLRWQHAVELCISPITSFLRDTHPVRCVLSSVLSSFFLLLFFLYLFWTLWGDGRKLNPLWGFPFLQRLGFVCFLFIF